MVLMIENDLVDPAWGMPGEVIPAARLLHAPLHSLAWSWGFIPVDTSDGLAGNHLAARDDQGSPVPDAAWLPVRLEAPGLKVDDPRLPKARFSVEAENAGRSFFAPSHP